MLSAERLLRTVVGRGFSQDSIRNIAYLIDRIEGTGNPSDFAATVFARRIKLGLMSHQQANAIMEHSSDLNISVHEDIDDFCDK